MSQAVPQDGAIIFAGSRIAGAVGLRCADRAKTAESAKNLGEDQWMNSLQFLTQLRQAGRKRALITELIESEVLPVDRAHRIFDMAMERANSARDRLPDAERLIAHIRDNLKWGRPTQT